MQLYGLIALWSPYFINFMKIVIVIRIKLFCPSIFKFYCNFNLNLDFCIKMGDLYTLEMVTYCPNINFQEKKYYF